jgi:hypothetical protein
MVREGSFHDERRSAERFLVSWPVETDKGPGVTRDVSVSGLCLSLTTGQLVKVGDPMEVVMTVPDHDSVEIPAQLKLILQSKVVRVEAGSGAVAVQILPDEESRRFALAF